MSTRQANSVGCIKCPLLLSILGKEVELKDVTAIQNGKSVSGFLSMFSFFFFFFFKMAKGDILGPFSKHTLVNRLP